MTVQPITAALVLDGIRAMDRTQRAEVLDLLGIATAECIAHSNPIGYTTATLAAVLGISERAVRGAIERGDLAAAKRGRRWLIDGDSVARYVAPRRRATPSVPRSLPHRRPRPMAEALSRLPDDR